MNMKIALHDIQQIKVPHASSSSYFLELSLLEKIQMTSALERRMFSVMLDRDIDDMGIFMKNNKNSFVFSSHNYYNISITFKNLL